MITKQFREKMDHLNGRIYQMDLSKEEEREYYLETVGGEENLSRFPILWRLFQKACLHMPAKNVSENEEPDNVKFEFYDLIYELAKDQAEDAVNSDEPKYLLTTNYTGHFLDLKSPLQDPAPPRPRNICVYGKVYDPESSIGAFIEINDSFEAANEISIACSSEVFYNLRELEGRKLRQKVIITVIDEDSQLHTYTVSKDMEAADAEDIPFSSIELKMPISKNHTNQIRILYGRNSKQLDHPDYTYDTNDIRNGFLRTIVPVKLDAVFKKPDKDGSYYTFEGISKPISGEKMTRPVLSVESKDWKTFRSDLSDTEFYDKYNSDKFFYVVKDQGKDQTLTMDLYNPEYAESTDGHYDWADNMTGDDLDGRDRVSMLNATCCFNIYKRNAQGKIIKVMTLSVGCRSRNPEDLNRRKYFEFKEGSPTIFIPPVRLWWGCYAKDTKIAMADGTCKMAAEIEIGDQVRGSGSEILTVNNVYTSLEETLISIRTDAGHQIRITKNHPLLKENKEAVNAAQIAAGDCILAENGDLVTVTAVEKIVYDDEVYNFSFQNHEEGIFIIADGLYAGDFYAQNSSAERAEPTKLQKQAALEIKQLTQWRKEQNYLL